MFFVLRQERGYRMLFSDTHLTDLAKCLEAARAGGVAHTTFEGVSVAWEPLPKHLALTLGTKRPVAPAAASFMLAFALEVAAELGAKASPVATLQTDKRAFAIVWELAAIDLTKALPVVDDARLPALRKAAADAMKTMPVTAATLAAYR